MSIARRYVAARYVLAALVATVAGSSAPVRADGGPQLILPLVAALAVASAARGLPMEQGAPGARRFGGLGFLPEQLQVPDLYTEAEQDFGDYLDQFEPPVDDDRYVWIELLPRRRNGWMASLAFDEESRGPLAGSNGLFSLELDYRF